MTGTLVDVQPTYRLAADTIRRVQTEVNAEPDDAQIAAVFELVDRTKRGQVSAAEAERLLEPCFLISVAEANLEADFEAVVDIAIQEVLFRIDRYTDRIGELVDPKKFQTPAQVDPSCFEAAETLVRRQIVLLLTAVMLSRLGAIVGLLGRPYLSLDMEDIQYQTAIQFKGVLKELQLTQAAYYRAVAAHQ